VLVTVNTDDPAMMGLDLGQEYQRVGEAYGYGLQALGDLAIEGIDSTWLDESDRRSLRLDFERALSEPRAPTGPTG
jgi:adenosine deaminase